MSKDKEPVMEVGKGAKQEPESVKLARETTRAMMEEMLPALLAAQRVHVPSQAAGRPQPPPTLRCQTCGQLEVACNNKHVSIVVYPTRFPEFAEWYQGSYINGVRYLSNDGNHKVVVPEAAAGDIVHQVQAFENNERETRLGRVKHHNSGNVNSPRPVSQYGSEGWR